MTIPELLVKEGKWCSITGPLKPWQKKVTAKFIFDDWPEDFSPSFEFWLKPKQSTVTCTSTATVGHGCNRWWGS